MNDSLVSGDKTAVRDQLDASEVNRYYCLAALDGHRPCLYPMCREGRCLCMDTEQMNLVLSLADEAAFGGSRVIEASLKTGIKGKTVDDDHEVCSDYKEGHNLYRFIRGNGAGRAGDKIARLGKINFNIPEQSARLAALVFYINGHEEIWRRDTGFYLLESGLLSDKWLRSVLVTIVCRAAEIYLEPDSREQKRLFAGDIEELFAKLDKTHKNLNENQTRIEKLEENYIYFCRDAKMTMATQMYHQFHKRINPPDGHRIREEQRLADVYWFMKKFLHFADIRISPPEKFWMENLPDVREYGDFYEMGQKLDEADGVKADVVKQILAKLELYDMETGEFMEKESGLLPAKEELE